MTTQPATKRGSIENIQALRGLAALLVLYAHFREMISNQFPHVFFPHAGTIGVDLFFVISGFVISLTADKRHRTAADFILARLARVVPLYFCLTLIVSIIKLIVPGFGPNPMTFSAVWNGLFYIPLFDWSAYSAPPIGIGWTLSFEMLFYLIFSLCLCFLKPSRAVAVLPLVFALLSFVGIWYTGSWFFPRFLTDPFVLEFSFGCIIYQLRQFLHGWVSCVLLLLMAPFYELTSLYYAHAANSFGYLGNAAGELRHETQTTWVRVVLWGIPMGLIVSGMAGLEFSRIFIFPKPFVWLGAISYSLYLTHWAAGTAMNLIVSRYNLHAPWLIGLGAPLSCIVVAALCYYCIELPLTSRAQKWAARFAAASPGGEAR